MNANTQSLPVQIDTDIAKMQLEEMRLEQALKANRIKQDKLHEVYIRNGRWTRAFLVTDGHLHKTTRCNTCYPTTAFFWMTELSGLSEEEIVELAGERACTVCFPDAPVDVRNRPSQLSTDEEKERAAQREERAAKAAAAKAAEIVTETGKTYKTERAASNAVVAAVKDVAHYGWDSALEDLHPSHNEWVAEAKEAAEAFAAKTGTEASAKIEDAINKAAAHVIKDAKDWNKSPMSSSPMYSGKVEVPAKADIVAGLKRFF